MELAVRQRGGDGLKNMNTDWIMYSLECGNEMIRYGNIVGRLPNPNAPVARACGQ